MPGVECRDCCGLLGPRHNVQLLVTQAAAKRMHSRRGCYTGDCPPISLQHCAVQEPVVARCGHAFCRACGSEFTNSAAAGMLETGALCLQSDMCWLAQGRSMPIKGGCSCRRIHRTGLAHAPHQFPRP